MSSPGSLSEAARLADAASLPAAAAVGSAASSLVQPGRAGRGRGATTGWWPGRLPARGTRPGGYQPVGGLLRHPVRPVVAPSPLLAAVGPLLPSVAPSHSRRGCCVQVGRQSPVSGTPAAGGQQPGGRSAARWHRAADLPSAFASPSPSPAQRQQHRNRSSSATTCCTAAPVAPRPPLRTSPPPSPQARAVGLGPRVREKTPASANPEGKGFPKPGTCVARILCSRELSQPGSFAARIFCSQDLSLLLAAAASGTSIETAYYGN